MININFGLNIFFSFVCTLAILLFYGVRQVRPELAREYDLLFVTLGLFYSGIIAAHGWRLDPILLFSQALIIIMLLCSAWENVRLRGMVYALTEICDSFMNRKKK